jgi:hypothetical protein
VINLVWKKGKQSERINAYLIQNQFGNLQRLMAVLTAGSGGGAAVSYNQTK